MDVLGPIFAMLAIGYTLVWFTAYRFMKVERPVPMQHHPTPIETTTAEERARGVSSFEMARGGRFMVTRAGFVCLVIVGYVGLAAAFAIAWMVLRASTR